MPNYKYLVIGWLCFLSSFPGLFFASAVEAQEAGTYVEAIDLFPDSVGGFLRIVDFPTASGAWQKTSLSALADDPAMEPFWESQRANAEQELLNRGLKVGVRLDDLRQIASGEVVAAWSTFPDPKRPYAVTLVADVRGRQQQAESVLEQIDAAMKDRRATRNDVGYLDQTIRVYSLRRAPGQLQIQQVAITLDDQRLIASDRQVVVERMLDAIGGQQPDERLVDAEDFGEVMARIGKPEANECHWFARPLPFARILREVAETDRGNRVDIVQLLEGQGFDAVRAGGGRVKIGEAEYDLLHQGFIWAPTPAGQTERFRLAARMLQFPNVPLSPLPRWIGDDVATCLRMSWKMEEAFWAAETLVDEAFGDEIFRPTLEGIKEDPEGPQIDIPNNVIAHFDDQLILLTDNVEPAAPDSERMLVAVRLSDYEKVAEAVRKAMESEPDATRVEALADHPAWKVVPREEPLDFEDDLFDDFGFEADQAPQEERPAPLLEQWAITVVQGPAEEGQGTVAYLIFSSHAEMLVDAVRRIQEPPGEGLASQEDVQTVFAKIEQLGGDARSLDRVNRLSKAWRTKYELLRQGKLRESDSFLASLVRRLAEGDESVQDPEDRSAAKLPDFQEIRKYLNPAGSFLHTEDDGWSLTGFLLAEEPEAAASGE